MLTWILLLLAVTPSQAAKLRPVTLGALIEKLLPTDQQDQLSWSHGLSAPVRWVTNGYETDDNGRSKRDGLARVRVGGRTSTVLKASVQEVAWTVSLSTGGPPKFGPETISIQPGYEEDSCFGELGSECTFTPQEALAGFSGAKKLICGKPAGGLNTTTVYQLSTSTRRAFVRFATSGGSGGVASFVEISPTPLECDY